MRFFLRIIAKYDWGLVKPTSGKNMKEVSQGDTKYTLD